MFHRMIFYRWLREAMLTSTPRCLKNIKPFQIRKDVPVTVTIARSDGSEEEREVNID